MTDRQSEPQDQASSDEPRSVDTETRFLKTLSAVFKDYRDVLPRLPELTEQCLNNEPLDQELVESRLKNEIREGDAERSAERKRSDLEFSLRKQPSFFASGPSGVSREGRLRFTAENSLTKICPHLVMSAGWFDWTSVERELEEKDKLLQESERKTKCLEEECSKLKKELEKKEKEISEIEKVQEEKISAVKKELENKVKEISDKANQLQKEKDDLQKIFIYGEYQKALKEHMSSHDDITNDLAVRDKEIQEYMERCAAMAERMVKMDQRRDENTQSANWQSDLEKEYRNYFRDGTRVDAIDVIEAKLNETRRTKQSNADDQLKAYRLACYIFEISYECSLKAKDTFLTFYSSLLDTLVTEAPTIGSSDVIYKKLSDFTPSRTRKGVKQESSSEVMVLVKEEAGRHNLDSLVKMIKKEIKEKWRESQCKEENLPSYDKSLKNKLKPYFEYCTRFAWRMVTQVPPLMIDYKSTTYNPASHNESQAFPSSASQHPPDCWASMQDRPKMVKCYVWPTLHDFDGRVIEKGDVVLEEQSTGRFATIV